MHVDPIDAVSALVRAAVVSALGTDCDADPQVRRSDRADLQADLAMRLARKVKRAPRAIADAIVAALPVNDVIDRIEVANPGFLNIWLRAEWLSAAAAVANASERLAVETTTAPERVVIDYSHPNVAKEMHVGHLRSTVIGDALARVLAWRGHTILRQNHIGDWGTPFGMLIEHVIDLGAAHTGIAELAKLYKSAREKFDSDPAFANRSRARVVLLQAGDPQTLQDWRALVDLSTRYFETIYAELGVTLQRADIAGESFYNDQLAPLAHELEASGYARISDGALCAFPAGFQNREGAPLALMLRKSDGGFGYAITDLAAIRYRLAQLRATRILYVVGAPQTQHLAMVVTAARELGWLAPPARAEHVAFGSVLGKDGRMLMSRAGEAVRLVDMISEAVTRAEIVARAKAGEAGEPIDEAALKDIAHAVGVGAIKYADLSSDRVKDYIFDLDRMVSFDGNTAGYCQYAHARARSVLRKAIELPDVPIAIDEPVEHELVLHILGLGAVVRDVERTLEPHRLVSYCYTLASAFTAFYDACPILKAEPAVRGSRLQLTRLAARTLACALGLLGIPVPERM
ncbi:MAG TPA: arginine--tRNA ligase [Kofleriaceae bacterium]|jgi:arginyl-tRNA synthetase|nr:arginine--tRNA ligase [Kofleriaceae bacterium]